MKDLKVISVEELHTTIHSFIVNSENIIGDYDDMKELILLMIRAGYMFNMDRDRLRDAMEDITFMLCPDDDANRDRVERGLEYDDSDDSDSDEDLMQYGYDSDKDSTGGDKSCDKGCDKDREGASTPVEDIGDTSDMNISNDS